MPGKEQKNITTNPRNAALFEELEKQRPASSAPAPVRPQSVTELGNGLKREDY